MLFAAFSILSLALIFVILTTCLAMFLFGGLCISWTWVTLPRLGRFSAILSSNIFSSPFPLQDPSNANISVIDVVPEFS